MHKLGFDDALIRSDKPELVDSRRADNRSIGRIPQRAGQGRNLRSDIHRERQTLEGWIGLDLAEKISDRLATPQSPAPNSRLFS